MTVTSDEKLWAKVFVSTIPIRSISLTKKISFIYLIGWLLLRMPLLPLQKLSKMATKLAEVNNNCWLEMDETIAYHTIPPKGPVKSKNGPKSFTLRNKKE